jgi:hypothetical protein
MAQVHGGPNCHSTRYGVQHELPYSKGELEGTYFRTDRTQRHGVSPRWFEELRKLPESAAAMCGKSDSTTESGEFGEINIQGTRLPPDGTQSYNGAQIGTVGARGSTGAATGSGGGQNGNSPSSSQPQTPQKPQSNPSQSGCAHIACPVVQSFKEPPPPFALSPAVTPALIALDYDENFLQRTLEALGLLTRVSVVSLQLYNATGDPQDGPFPPEAGTPEPQTTEQPYNPGALRFNPQTGEMQFSGRVGELPPEFFEVPF